MHFKNVCADITRGVSEVEKKLVHIGKVPHEDNEASRDVEKILMCVSDVLMHVDLAARVLRENPFELLFFPPDMHEERKDVVFSLPEVHLPAILFTSPPFAHDFFPGVMHGQQGVDTLPFRVMHPSTFLRTFSPFVLKRRAFARTSAGFVHDDVPIVLPAAMDVENGREGDDNVQKRH
jgi:hypothetical protein